MVQLNSVPKGDFSVEEIEAGLWLHDIARSEEESAAIAKAMLSQMGMPSDFYDNVAGDIAATKHGQLLFQKPEQRLIADIDLSSLATPWQYFVANAILLQKEFGNQSPSQFFEQTRNLFRVLLTRTSIYGTDFFFSKYEDRAKKNIQTAFAEMEKNKLPQFWKA
ncbi:MAG: hypothetical protein WC310_02630 [Patescibacteria group bacterium]